MNAVAEQYWEQRGPYAIEAIARRRPEADSWHPELRLTRAEAIGAAGPSQSFRGLMPLFDTAKAAVQYAAQLGRALVDEDSALLKI